MRLIASLLSLVGLVPLAASAADQRLSEVDRLAEAEVGKSTPGLAVLVMKKGKLLHIGGYGVANVDSGAPVTADTVFDLASVSKNQTALAARLLMEEGKLREDMAVAEILPAFAEQPGRRRPITVSDLIHHVSGLADYLDGNEDLDYQDDTETQTVVDWLAAQPLAHAPGRRFEYSNSGYVTLAAVVAAADGRDSLRDVLAERLWRPLGMTATNIAALADGVPEDAMVTGYKGKKGRFEESMEPTVVEGDGNVYTTLADLSRYEAALATGAVLSQTELLFANGAFDNGKPIDDGAGYGYGYGWSVGLWQGQQYASHSGSWMGTSTAFQRNLTTGLTVIVLANGEDFGAEAFAVRVEKEVVAAHPK